jgi:phage gp29-like protein
VAYVFKHFSLRDWLNSSEKFGMPGVVGRTDAAYGSEEWNEFVEAIRNFSQDWSAVFNRSNSVELIEARAAADGPYAPLVEKMDRAITTLWRGADLGTMSAHNAAGASLQAEETDLLEVDDAQLIGETLNTQVSRWVLQYHFGDAPALAYLKIRVADKKETDLSLKIDQFLLQAGAPIAIKDALARYDRPAPKPGEALLKPLVAAPPTLTSR